MAKKSTFVDVLRPDHLPGAYEAELQNDLRQGNKFKDWNGYGGVAGKLEQSVAFHSSHYGNVVK